MSHLFIKVELGKSLVLVLPGGREVRLTNLGPAWGNRGRDGNHRIGVEAPHDVRVDRAEIHEARRREEASRP